jgi:hypothetical protein
MNEPDYLRGCLAADPSHIFRHLTVGDIEDLLAAADQLERNGWQPIETAPKDGTVILYSGKSDGIVPWVTCGRWTEEGWFEINLDDSDMHGHPDYPALWRPMPAPPEAK